MVLLVGGYCIIAASVGDTKSCCTKLNYLNLKSGPSRVPPTWTPELGALVLSEFYPENLGKRLMLSQ